MIKREHIKQAIRAIAARDSSIGYTLDEMLSMGMIDVPEGTAEDPGEDPFYFLFDGQKVRVNKILYFNEGTVPIERGLLIKYGELEKKQEILDRKGIIRYQEASEEIRSAGLRLLVTHEIDFAISRLRGRQGVGEAEERLRKIPETPRSPGGGPIGADETVMFLGLLEGDTKARFMPFPICMETLMQVADINLEFFHVRFILECLIRGLEENLFACMSESRVMGLVYLIPRSYLFGRDLEIKFLATLRGTARESPHWPPPPRRGIGTFLVAGVWLFWKTRCPGVKRIILDAEVGARRFYRSLGFEPTGLSGYYLADLRGYLLKSVLVMTRNRGDLGGDVIRELQEVIRKGVKGLRKRRTGRRDPPSRKAVLASVKECMIPEARPEFAKTVVNTLLKHGKGIPEFNELVDFALKNASSEIKATIQNAARTGS